MSDRNSDNRQPQAGAADQKTLPGLPSPPQVLTEENLDSAIRMYFEHLDRNVEAGFRYALALVTAAEAGNALPAYIWANCLCAEASYFLNDMTQMRHFLERIRQCRQRLSTDVEHCIYHTALGTMLGQGESLAESTAHLLKAIAIGRGKADCLRSYRQALHCLADNYQQAGNFSEALTVLLTLQELTPLELREEAGTSKTDLLLGTLYKQIKDNDKARQYLERYLQGCRKMLYYQGMAEAYLDIGDILIDENRLDKARNYLRKAESISEERGFVRLELSARLTLMHVLTLEGEYLAAQAMLEEIQGKSQLRSLPDLHLQLMTESGMLYKALGRNEAASGKLEAALTLAVNSEYRQQEMEISLLLADLAGLQGASAKEAALRKRAAELHDEILGVRRLRQLMKIELSELHHTAQRELGDIRRQQQEQQAYTKSIEKELKALALQKTQRDEALRKLRRLIKRDSSSQPKDMALRQQLLATIDSSLGSEEPDPLLANDLQRNYGALVMSLKAHGPRLTPTEIKICILLRLDFATKEIAVLLFKSVETVRTHRRHIRGKLALPKKMNLLGFLMSL